MKKDKICISNIINIGDEILSGHTVNTNSSYIASILYDIGIFTKRITAISDMKKDIIAQLDESMKNSDLIFITGGLGPTNDDLTKKVICAYFGFELKFREDIWKHILELFSKRGLIPDEINIEQALFPDSIIAVPIFNSVGTAPGIHIKFDDKHIFVMPGVPNEMKTMMSDYVTPFLKDNFSDILYYRDINTTDIPESSLYSILSNDPAFPFGCDIAFLPQGYGVTVRVKNFGEKDFRKNYVDKAVLTIESLIRNKIFAYDMKTPQEELVAVLKNLKLKISVAESCTGGLFMNNLTNVPGASGIFTEGFVTYSNDSKFNTLSVNSQTLCIDGAVSTVTVSEMLDGLLAVTKAGIVCAISGIAGPDGGSVYKPVGTVVLGFCLREKNKRFVNKFLFTGDRITIKEKASNKLMVEIIKYLKKDYN
ncbi:MAG: nicotinamide-nucleotide amidohydrolase family protein [Candidatus Delongbacteria bacterium]|nr:nicotinamide-nucleotide amidohydrolase family protein [Candidatus Delongbacteria bacterium]MCG2760528.1 nicotinamide-nucleotide amidohydrolase family protein [Candidatus Delongbacteria bacterium]